ncbi:sulfate transporter CysZ [Methylomagnum sp.]
MRQIAAVHWHGGAGLGDNDRCVYLRRTPMTFVNPKLTPPLSLSPTYLLRGLRLLMAPDLRHFVWMPLLINLGLYGLALWAGVHYFAALMHWLLPAWLGFLAWVLWPIFALSFVLVMYFTFTVLANLIGSPFYSRLAEKALARTGKALPPPPGLSLGKELTSGMAAEFKRLGFFLTRAVPLLILFVIPGVNVVAPFLWLAFNAWFLGMEYLAYPLEAHGVSFEEQRRLAKDMRVGLLSFGGMAMLGLAVPGLNILMAPAAVVGAALYVSEKQP